MSVLAPLRRWAATLKRDVATLWFARADPRTPWTAKLVAIVAVGYALSPIDLIPDFIPLLGLLDDLLVLPVLVWLALRLLPPDVIERSRAQADAWSARTQPRGRGAAVVIVALWLAAAAALVAWFLRR